MFQPHCPERLMSVTCATAPLHSHGSRWFRCYVGLWISPFHFCRGRVVGGGGLCPLMRRLDENKQAYLPSVWRFLLSFLPSSRLLLPGRIRQDQSVINGLLWFCSLETSFPCHQSGGAEFSSYKWTSRRCRMTPPSHLPIPFKQRRR